MKVILYPHVPPPHVQTVAVGDLAAYGVAAAAIVGWLPSIAAGLSVIYLTIQIILAIKNWNRNYHPRE